MAEGTHLDQRMRHWRLLLATIKADAKKILSLLHQPFPDFIYLILLT